MANYKNTIFQNSSDIDSFFKKMGSNGFADWFNSNIAGRQNWSGIRLQSPADWQSVWSNSNVIFNKDSFNLIEFLCINSIIMNETGGQFRPLTEYLGRPGHPGIAYAFDKISGLKLGYNTLDTNKTAYALFRDSSFKNAHVTKPLGDILKDTTDTRWQGDLFPQGFSGNVSNETTVSGKTNTFLTEADFSKFRGRGYIQTTGRAGYLPLIDYILKYNGSDKVITRIKSEWSKYGNNKEVIASSSTNQQWDDIFQKTNSIIANYAIYIHARNGGAKGKKNYHIISPGSSDLVLAKDIKDVAYCVAGGGATNYANLFYARVMQQLNLIEDFVEKNDTSQTEDTNTEDTGQDESREERTGQDGSRNLDKQEPTKNIINVFEPTIKPAPIKFNLPPQEDQQKEIAQSLGNIPFVWYNSYQINQREIDFLQLSTFNNMPMIKLVFRDSLNLMKDKGFPLDDSKISVFINPRSKQLKPIHMDFKIIKFSVNKGVYNMTGVIDVNGLYISVYKSYPNMTSFDALKTISKDIGLGFNTNIDDTDDRMTWINTGSKVIDFIDDIIDYSYKSDETYLLQYIDFYYNLTYVDIEKELNRDIKEELGVSNIGIEDISKLENQEQVSKLFLTNDAAMSTSNSYFSSYRIINNSTSVSLQEGYLTRVKFYDELKKDFLVFDVDSITSKGDKTILLKGAPQDETFYKENVNLVYTGKIDVDNMHKNFHYSSVQNARNISELEKIGLEINMKTPNYNLYRFQKISVLVSNQASTPSQSHINNRLSGEWLIIDIMYKFDGTSYSQVIKLIKRELELSEEELKQEPVTEKSPNTKVEDGNSSTDGGSQDENIETNSESTKEEPNSPEGDDSSFPLTKEIFRKIYQGKVNQKVIEKFYGPMKKAMIDYKIDTKERIAAFLSQINAETGYLVAVTEYGTGNDYEGRKDLGNVQSGDGVKFKGRGLIQLTGRSNYKKTGDFLNKDFISDTRVVAADNESHRKGASTNEQIENSILASIRFWIKGSSWGNLNDYADNMNIKKPMGLGSAVLSDLPNKHSDGSSYGNKRNNNFSRSYAPNDLNFNNFTLICFGVNGGYNGYRDRVENWIKIREYLK